MKRLFTFLLVFTAVTSFAQQQLVSVPLTALPVPASRNAAGEADTILWDAGNGSAPAGYRLTDPDVNFTPRHQAGWIAGTDQLLSSTAYFTQPGNIMEGSCQIFDNNRKIKIIGAKFCFIGRGYASNDTNSKVTFNLYALDSTFTNSSVEIVPGPGSVIAQTTKQVAELRMFRSGLDDIRGGSYTVAFPQPIEIDSSFAIGISLENMDLYDTVGLATSPLGKVHPPDKALVKFMNLSWAPYKGANGWGYDLDMAIFPIIDQTQYTTIMADICTGNSYIFDEKAITQSGIYMDTLKTDDDHDSIITLNLTVIPTIDTSFQLIKDASGAAVFTANATGNNMQYEWIDCNSTFTVGTDKVFMPANSGSYQLKVNHSGCIGFSSCRDADVSCRSYFTVTPDAVTEGEYIGHNESKGVNLQYLWAFGDDSTSTLAYPTHTYAEPGKYNVCLTIQGDQGCSAVYCDSSFYVFKTEGGLMKKLSVTNPDGINDVVQVQFTLLPNPAKDVCTIYPANTGTGNWSATLYNVQGQLVENLFANQAMQQRTFSTSQLPSGVYIIKINTADGKTGTKKLVVE